MCVFLSAKGVYKRPRQSEFEVYIQLLFLSCMPLLSLPISLSLSFYAMLIITDKTFGQFEITNENILNRTLRTNSHVLVPR